MITENNKDNKKIAMVVKWSKKDDNFVVNKIKDLMAIQGEIGLTVKVGLFSGKSIIYIHEGLC
jgi:hypothetical protein